MLIRFLRLFDFITACCLSLVGGSGSGDNGDKVESLTEYCRDLTSLDPRWEGCCLGVCTDGFLLIKHNHQRS